MGKEECRLIGNCNCVGISPFDINSLTHLGFGHITYLITNSIIICVIIFVVWEIIENKYILQRVFPYHKDAIINSVVDFLLGIAGSVFTYYLPIYWSFIALAIEFSIWVLYQYYVIYKKGKG